MLEFLTTHFITILLMAGFSLKLAMRREAKGTEIRYLWLTVFCTVILSRQFCASRRDFAVKILLRFPHQLPQFFRLSGFQKLNRL